MAADNNIIIIKKKKGGHGGHHGGAWWAFADFMTAMMASSLSCGLSARASPSRRPSPATFATRGVRHQERRRWHPDGGKQADAAPAKTSTHSDADREALERSVSRIRERLNSVPELKTLRNQIEYTITDEGLRIDLLESAQSSFFDSGSAGLRPESGRILAIIAKELGTLDNSIILEGHTDSHQYASANGYTNWELSADRANAARRVMQHEGLRPTQVSAVRGHADRQLRVVADPFDPRNRRVSVIVKSLSK